MSNVDKAVEALDKLAQDEAGRKALGEIADSLARIFGTKFVKAPVQAITNEPVAPEQTEFDVLLADVGLKKIDVIKAIREITGLGLKESKDFVEGGVFPKAVKETVSKEDALKLKTRLEAAGATVVVK